MGWEGGVTGTYELRNCGLRPMPRNLRGSQLVAAIPSYFSHFWGIFVERWEFENELLLHSEQKHVFFRLISSLADASFNFNVPKPEKEILKDKKNAWDSKFRLKMSGNKIHLQRQRFKKFGKIQKKKSVSIRNVRDTA